MGIINFERFATINLFFCNMDEFIETITAGSRLLNTILDRLTADYSSAYIINFKEDTIHVFRQNEEISRRYPNPTSYTEALEAYISTDVFEEDREMLRVQATPENVKALIGDSNTCVIRFRDISSGHVRWHHMRIRSLSEDNEEMLVAFADRHEIILEKLVRNTVSNDQISSYYCNLISNSITVVHKSDVYQPTGQYDVTLFSEMMKDKVYLMDEPYRKPWLEFSNPDHVRETLSHEERMEFIYSSHVTGQQRWVKATFYPMAKREDGTPITVTLAYKNASKETIEVINLNEETNRQKKKLEEDLNAIKGLASVYSLLAIINIETDDFNTYTISPKIPEEALSILKRTNNATEIFTFLLDNFFHPDDRAGIRAHFGQKSLAESLRSKKNFSSRARMLSGNGTYTWVNITAIKFDAEDEPATRIALGFENINEEVRIEQEREEALEQARKAKEASKLKTQFVQNISHDIRTPLNAIVGFSQLLGMPDGCLTEAEKEEFSGYISNSADLLTMLVDDVLNMSDIENNILRIVKAECNCNEICDRAISCSMMRVPAGVKLYYTSEFVDSFKIYADSRRVQQILVNLLSNACKHTAEGEIHVHCSQSENPGYITFSVADTGTGVSEEIAKDIFERFVTRDAHEGGHGMGLDICKDLAVRLDGDIRLDTTYKDGARFLLILPLKESVALGNEALEKIEKDIVGSWIYERNAGYVIGCSDPVWTSTTPLITEAIVRPDHRYIAKKVYGDPRKEPRQIQGHFELLSDGNILLDRLNDDGNIHHFKRMIHRVGDDELVLRIEKKEFFIHMGRKVFSKLPVFDYGLYYFKRK